MENKFDFRSKLTKLTLIITSVAAFAACFTMLTYASQKTIILSEEEQETEEVIEEVATQKSWSVDVSSLRQSGKSLIFMDVPSQDISDESFAYFDYGKNSLVFVIYGTRESYFSTNAPQGDFSLVTKAGINYNEGVTTVSLDFSEPVYCDSSYSNGRVKVSFTPVKDSDEIVVFVDPGHGGSSNGTKAGETAEKDIVLNIASAVEKASRGKPYRVILSRYCDTYSDTEERIRALENSDADYYIGLHLSSNADDVKAFGMKAVYNGSYFRHGIENVDFADRILKSTVNNTVNLALGVFEADDEDAILQVIDVPGTVLYAGYISNDAEKLLLTNSDYVGKIANGIIEALDGVTE